MKDITARGIIISNNEVILLFRRKKKKKNIKEYYAIPGGHLENNETLEECLKREIKEELSIDVEIIDYLGIVEKKKKIDHIFNCKWIKGNLMLGGEEKEQNNENNYYEIRRININDLDKINLYEENYKMIKKAIEGIDNNGCKH